MTDPHPSPTVAYQGEPGAYSEAAIRRALGASAATLPCVAFADVAAAVIDGRADLGMLPVENTLAGSVAGAYAVLASGALAIVAEVVLPIRHCLLARPGTALGSLRRVVSHPVALAQCTRLFAARPELAAEPVFDTAGAARIVAASADPDLAAIASRAAAERYDLAVLAENVEDRPDNQTRFVLVRRAGESPLPTLAPLSGTPTKLTLLAEPRNEPGALAAILAPFADAGFNLSKLETQPTGEPWRYRFFLDFEVEGRAALALALARAAGARVLGRYGIADLGLRIAD